MGVLCRTELLFAGWLCRTLLLAGVLCLTELLLAGVLCLTELLLAGVLLLRLFCSLLETAGTDSLALSVEVERLFLTETVVCCCLLLLTASRLTELLEALVLLFVLTFVFVVFALTLLLADEVFADWLLVRTAVCPASVA